MSTALIDTAVSEFNEMIEEEIQRRIKEQETHEHQEKQKKSPKVQRNKEDGSLEQFESDSEEFPQETLTENRAVNGHPSNGTSNGHHNVNGHNENNVEDKTSVTSTI